MKKLGLQKGEAVKKDFLKLARYNFKNLHMKVDKIHSILEIAKTNSYMLSFSTEQRVPNKDS